MENRARITMDANRRIVQEGLDRRKLETRLDAFENDMIQRVNENCDNAEWQRRFDDTARLDAELCKARALARAEHQSAVRQMRKDTALGCLIFFAYVVVLICLTGWTYLPVWAAGMYIAGGALFLAMYLCRVHGLLSMEDKK